MEEMHWTIYSLLKHVQKKKKKDKRNQLIY